MRTRDFTFDLPEELIAQEPPAERGSSRLMVVQPRREGAPGIEHRMIRDLPAIVEPGTVVVVNDSRVRRGRLFARSLAPEPRQGTEEARPLIELLLVEQLDPRTWKAMCSHAKRQRVGKRLFFDDGLVGEIVEASGEFRTVRFDRPVDDAWLDRFGRLPLPPYIKRPDTSADAQRYQTVYSGRVGSIAAPTAGLHLTNEILDAIRRRGAEVVRVTLDVGPGTFLPIRTETVEAHVMHEERYEIGPEAAEAITRARREMRRVLAVGTTSVRTLESAWDEGRLKPGKGATLLYIYPGYRFKVVDELLTNFHTPASSLLLLVSAFAGIDAIRASYAEAVSQRYRFFSYGDAMLIRSRYPESPR